jgi:hypothetical protein
LELVSRHKVIEMRPVAFGEALTAGTRLTLFSDDKPDREVEDEEGRIHLLIHVLIEEESENRWSLWRPDQAGFDFSVPGPITNIALAVGQLAIFQGASDERI